MILVDTTVLVYATGEAHPLREPARSLVRAIADGELSATTTPEVIQEFTHVRARRRDRRDATALARQFCGLLQPLVTPDEDDLKLGLEIFELHESIGAFDAVLAATVRRRRLDALATADRGFTTVPGLAVRLLSAV